MRDIEIAVQQFADKIGIGMPRIQQIVAILDPVALRRQRSDFLLPLFEYPCIFAPRQQATRPGDADSGKHKKSYQRERLGQAVSRKKRASRLHVTTESQIPIEFKQQR